MQQPLGLPGKKFLSTMFLRTVLSKDDVVKGLFSLGEQGAWYDPSDLSTLFQDSAGTTPVTAMEQPVGRMLDKSGRNNHATQATAANRPVLSSRVNLLLATDTLTTQSVTTLAAPYTLSFTGTGTITLSGASTAGPLVGTGTSNRVSLTFTSTAALLTLTVTGDVRLGQLEQASTATRYQRINTATDYDSVGFRNYLAFNGTNSAMATGSIDFTATNKMSIFAGARSVDATGRIVTELSVNAGNNSGAFYLVSGADAFNGWDSLGRGDAPSVVGQIAGVNATAPDNAVLSITHDIPASLSTFRRNGVASANATAAKGLGNFGNYPLYLGARAGTGVFFNGRIYSLIVRGAASSPSQIVSAEAYANSKTGAY